MNSPVTYEGASLRYFNVGEYHINRTGTDDVLLLVFSGTLCFTENDVPYWVSAGQYHIQRSGTRQTGDVVSDAPKYLYIHFHGKWTEGPYVLPRSGTFDISTLHPRMNELDRLAHGNASLIEQTSLFLQILSILYHKETVFTLADEIEAYIQQRYTGKLTLQQICEQFHFSKNHIINVFREKYDRTPYEYVLQLRLKQAKWLLEVTSDSVESVAQACGFGDYPHFFKIFRRETGLSPTRWRQKIRG